MSNNQKTFFEKFVIRKIFILIIMLAVLVFMSTAVFATTKMIIGANTDFTPYLEDDESGNDEIKKVCDKFLREYITWDMSDFEKEMQIIKFLTSTVAYADDEKVFDGTPVPSSMISDNFKAYGALVNHRAVCSGYAKAFELLARICGLQSMIITGTGIDKDGISGLHAWNQVCLDNEWYNVDVTWETPLRNVYINCADMEFSKTHIRNDGQVCSATRYGHDAVGYYLVTGQVGNNVIMDDVRKTYLKAYENNVIKIAEFKLDDNPLKLLGSKYDDNSNYFSNDEQMNNYIKTKLQSGDRLIVCTTPFGSGRDFSIDKGDWLKENMNINGHVTMQVLYEIGTKYDTRVLYFTIDQY